MNALPATAPMRTDPVDGIGSIAVNLAESSEILAVKNRPTAANQDKRATNLEEGSASIHSAFPASVSLRWPSNPTIKGKFHRTERLHRLAVSAKHRNPDVLAAKSCNQPLPVPNSVRPVAGRGTKHDIQTHVILWNPRHQCTALSFDQFNQPVIRNRLQCPRQIRFVPSRKRRQLGQRLGSFPCNRCKEFPVASRQPVPMVTLTASKSPRSPPLPNGMGVVKSNKPLSVRGVQRQRVAETMRTLRCDIVTHRHELHPMPGRQKGIGCPNGLHSPLTIATPVPGIGTSAW